jgi:hypothetical protein
VAARCNIEEISEMIAEVGGEALDAPGVAGVAVYQEIACMLRTLGASIGRLSTPLNGAIQAAVWATR